MAAASRFRGLIPRVLDLEEPTSLWVLEGCSAMADEVARVRKEKDFYRILKLEKAATNAEIKKAYRKLALLLHPDKCSEEGAEEAFKKVSTAYSCLSDPSKRRTYDVSGQDVDDSRFGGGRGGPVDVEEIFRNFMAAANEGGGGGGGDAFRGMGGMGGGGPRVHTFQFGGPSFAFSGGTPRSQNKGSSVLWYVVMIGVLIFFVYKFFSFVISHSRRLVAITLLWLLTRSLPPQVRERLRSVIVLVILLMPIEYLMLDNYTMRK